MCGYRNMKTSGLVRALCEDGLGDERSYRDTSARNGEQTIRTEIMIAEYLKEDVVEILQCIP